MKEAESASAIRRSTRPVKKRKCDPNNIYNVSSSSSKVVKREAQSEATVVKEETKPTRRGKGKLGCLMEMPLDVLFEIFKFVLPVDIMHLTWTTKNFRRVLMHKSSLTVWKSAFDNILGLPKCPPHMNYPQYASLVYGNMCSACAGTAKNADWGLLVRLCTACAKTHYGEVNHHDDTEVPEPDGMSHKLVLHRSGRYRRPTYIHADYEAVELKYYSLRGSARHAFATERRKNVAELKKIASKCKVWAYTVKRQHDVDVEAIKRARKEFIIVKLEALGWGSEVAGIRRPDCFADHKFVKIPKLLTDRSWKTIEPAMIVYMQTMKTHRLQRELTAKAVSRKCHALAIFNAYSSAVQLPHDDVFPGPPDFCNFPAVRAILESPVDVVIDESSFTAIVPDIPGMITEWRQQIKRELMSFTADKGNRWVEFRNGDYIFSFDTEQFPVRVTQENVSEDVLQLATTIFQCGICFERNLEQKEVEPLFYPDVLGHVCLTRPAYVHPWMPKTSVDVSLHADRYPGLRNQWSCRDLRVDAWASEIVHQLVQLAGLDPMKATVHDMDVCKARFYCTECLDQRSRVPACSWRSAIEHMAANHPKSLVKWRLLDPKATRKAVKEEKSFVKRVRQKILDVHEVDVSMMDVYSTWMCARCHGLASELPACPLEDLNEHLETEHGVHDPLRNVDYFRPFGQRSLKYDVHSRFALSWVRPDDIPWHQRPEWQRIVGLLEQYTGRLIHQNGQDSNPQSDSSDSDSDPEPSSDSDA